MSDYQQLGEMYDEERAKVVKLKAEVDKLKEENVYLHNDGSKDFIIGEQKQKLETQEQQIKELEEVVRDLTTGGTIEWEYREKLLNKH